MASGVVLLRPNVSRYSAHDFTVAMMSNALPDHLLPGSALARRDAVVSCWLCGISLHQNHMVPDGGSGCHDIRWYCEDTRACTQRWTSDLRHRLGADPAPPIAPPVSAKAAPSIQTPKPVG